MGSSLSDSDLSRPIFEIQPHAYRPLLRSSGVSVNIQQGLRRGYSWYAFG